MVNYMSEVAKTLGVELGEEFEIVFPNENCHATAIFNEQGLYIKEHNLANQDLWQLSALTNLLNGTYSIKYKPWKPKYGEEYWYVSESGTVYKNTFDNCSDYMTNHMNYYKLGNCYKTFAEAPSKYKKWQNFYHSDEVLEV